jgi:hypothetical protein
MRDYQLRCLLLGKHRATDSLNNRQHAYWNPAMKAKDPTGV